jgi:hypothetical protein
VLLALLLQHHAEASPTERLPERQPGACARASRSERSVEPDVPDRSVEQLAAQLLERLDIALPQRVWHEAAIRRACGSSCGGCGTSSVIAQADGVRSVTAGSDARARLSCAEQRWPGGAAMGLRAGCGLIAGRLRRVASQGSPAVSLRMSLVTRRAPAVRRSGPYVRRACRVHVVASVPTPDGHRRTGRRQAEAARARAEDPSQFWGEARPARRCRSAGRVPPPEPVS